MPRKKKVSTAGTVLNVELVLAGRQTTSYGIRKGQTVADVFNLAGADMNGELRLNGRAATGTTKIETDNSKIMAVPRVNGA
jgi:hypothetical protein